MKALFMLFHGMSAHSGITKKIMAQCAALNNFGLQTSLCYLRVSNKGERIRMAGGERTANFGSGILGRLMHRLCFGDVTRYIRSHQIDVVYIRYDHNASPFTIAWLRRLHKLGILIYIEIPTYPYDHEYKGKGFSMNLRLRIDRCFRTRLMRYADHIVTFTDDTHIFGRPTLRIANGIDFARVPLRNHYEQHPATIHLLGVANINRWHGFDRVITGLADYYRNTPNPRPVHFTIAGDDGGNLLDEYCRMIHQSGLGNQVQIVGPLSGKSLDEAFEQCDMGIASLGRHRSGITKIRTLKNREYAARGIPFVYSEQDDDFDAMPYVMKAPDDESPLDIAALVRFLDELHIPPSEIRASIEETLSWQKQMEVIVCKIKNTLCY